MIIDTHCHLNHFLFKKDINDVLYRAKSSNIKYIINISTTIKEFKKFYIFFKNNKNLFFSVGMHPEYVLNEEIVTVNELIKLSKKSKVIAIGETGLDFHKKTFDMYSQEKNFITHIEASQITKLPLIIHSRSSDKKMLELLYHYIKKQEFLFVIHCFTSSINLAKAVIDLGGYISFSGILTFNNTKNIRNIVKIIPKDRILIETDAPYLAPIPYRGKRNEPSFILKTLNCLSEILNINNEDAIEMTTKNAKKFFNKMNL